MWSFSAIPADGITEEAANACARGTLCGEINQRINNDFVAQTLGVLIPDILRTALIIVVAWLVVRFVRRVIRTVVRDMVERDADHPMRRHLRLASTQSLDPQRSAMRTETLGNVLRSVASIVIWTAALFIAVGSLRTVAIDLGPLIAGAGIVGVALGFGSQALVKDFLSGIFMLLEDQYGVGDIIDVGPATGVVEGITLRTTRLRDIEGVLWHVPNGQISRVGNLSQQWSRSLLDIPVAYATSVPHAIEVIKRTADELWREPGWREQVLEEPEVWGIEAFADDAMLIRLVLKVVPAKQWAVSRELRLRLKGAFDEAGIEIPFPQRTVWMRNEHADTERMAAGTTDREGFLPVYRPRSSEYDMGDPVAARESSSRDGQDGRDDAQRD